jgi:hypothetical protein
VSGLHDHMWDEVREICGVWQTGFIGGDTNATYLDQIRGLVVLVSVQAPERSGFIYGSIAWIFLFASPYSHTHHNCVICNEKCSFIGI